MPAFPALEPATRSYRLGRIPVTLQPFYAADPVRFSHGAKPFAYTLTLGYSLLTAAEAKLIRDHWRQQSGGTQPFLLSADAMSGHGSFSLVPSGTYWRYIETPSEEHLTAGLVNLTVTLETVEGVYLVGIQLAITATLTAGAASAA